MRKHTILQHQCNGGVGNQRKTTLTLETVGIAVDKVESKFKRIHNHGKNKTQTVYKDFWDTVASYGDNAGYVQDILKDQCESLVKLQIAWMKRQRMLLN